MPEIVEIGPEHDRQAENSARSRPPRALTVIKKQHKSKK
jgi:hypothetical protein